MGIPVIANGGSREMEKFSDIIKFRAQTGASSVMVARAAQWNVSILSKRGGCLKHFDEQVQRHQPLTGCFCFRPIRSGPRDPRIFKIERGLR